jgi:hypothetical protein
MANWRRGRGGTTVVSGRALRRAPGHRKRSPRPHQPRDHQELDHASLLDSPVLAPSRIDRVPCRPDAAPRALIWPNCASRRLLNSCCTTQSRILRSTGRSCPRMAPWLREPAVCAWDAGPKSACRHSTVGPRKRPQLAAERQALATLAAKLSRMPDQPPGESKLARISPIFSPKASRPRCSSSTRVRDGPSGTNSTSTSVSRSAS